MWLKLKTLLLFLSIVSSLLSFSACEDLLGSIGAYTISYINMDGAKNHSANPKTYDETDKAILLQAPTKANVYFVCWRKNSLTGAPVSSIPPGSNGDLTFYAQWTTTDEYNILAEQNRVRTNPKGYATWLKAQSGDDPCIAVLNSTAPLSPLVFNRGLYLAARAHAEDLIKSNTFAHNSSNGETLSVRILRFGSFSGSYSYGENIAGGYANYTAAVMGWVKSPGHLNNILNANYTQTGIAVMTGHPDLKRIYVTDFARNFVAKPF